MVQRKSQTKYSAGDRKLAKMLLQALDRNYYLESLGFHPFEWQKKVLSSTSKRKCINGARQSGKSTIISSIPAHTARFAPHSLSIIGAPTEDQANETMTKVMDFIRTDPDYPKVLKFSTEEIELENGSRIIVRPASPSGFRGYSCPRVIILDEASRILDETYTSGARPMLTGNPEGELLIISTPFGREGFFYRAMSNVNKNGGAVKDVWERYEIRSPFEPAGSGSDSYLEPYMPEEDFKALKAKEGIRGYYSPRHKDFDFQCEQLEEMKVMQYRQEYCCEFVEKAGQVFSFDEINNAFIGGEGIETLQDRISGFGLNDSERPISNPFTVEWNNE